MKSTKVDVVPIIAIDIPAIERRNQIIKNEVIVEKLREYQQSFLPRDNPELKRELRRILNPTKKELRDHNAIL